MQGNPKALARTENTVSRRSSQQCYLEPNRLTQSELSRRTGIPRTTINEIIKGKRPITAETALILGTFFNMDPQFWINLQSRYELRVLQFEKEKIIRARVQPLSA